MRNSLNILRKKEIKPMEPNYLGRTIKQQRVMSGLTLHELAHASGVSPSHLGRIERGERFPSARILGRIAKPLGSGESELFALAGYLHPQASSEVDSLSRRQLDAYVARVLSQEPVEVQRTVIAILSILKNMAKHS